MAERVLTIVGGGLVGLGTAYRAMQARSFDRIVVLEKEKEPGRHQSGHNSGVLHCGLYYQPGSLKAKLAVRGLQQLTDFCREFGIEHEICGKIVLAVDHEERARLVNLQERGRANGLQGLEWLEGEAITEREPHARGVAALLVPQEGIVDYAAVVASLVKQLQAGGHEVRTGARVTGLVPESDRIVVEAGDSSLQADFVVNCGGLHSDRLAVLGAGVREARIIPFRGEYFELSEQGRRLVKHLIYPVPDPGLPFLGVHFTRMIGGGIEAGPNAVLAFKREGYRKRDLSLRDLWDVFSYGGFYRFLARYPQAVFSEFLNSFSKAEFLRNLQRLVPEIGMSDLAGTGAAGVRAQAIAPTGDLLMDFAFQHAPRQLHVVNAPSPGATACLAIGEHILGEVHAATGKGVPAN